MLKDELSVLGSSRRILDKLCARILACTANVELLASTDILDASISLTPHSFDWRVHRLIRKHRSPHVAVSSGCSNREVSEARW